MLAMLDSARKTKIIATYGPSCDKPSVINDMILNGVNLFRLNASHNADPIHLKKVVSTIRRISKKQHKHVYKFVCIYRLVWPRAYTCKVEQSTEKQSAVSQRTNS